MIGGLLSSILPKKKEKGISKGSKVNVSQDHILSNRLAQWIKFKIKTGDYNEENKEDLLKLYKQLKSEGHCSGFAWTKRISDRSNTSPLHDMLQKISNWDPKKKPTEELKKTLEEVTNSIFLAQQCFEAWDNAGQETWGQDNYGLGGQDSVKIPALFLHGHDNAEIVQTYDSSTHPDAKDGYKQYTDEEFSDKLHQLADNNTMIALSGHDPKDGSYHAVEVKIIEQENGENSYLFYDSNDPRGEILYDNFADFHNAFKKAAGPEICFKTYEIEDFRTTSTNRPLNDASGLKALLSSSDILKNDVISFDNISGDIISIKKVDRASSDDSFSAGYELRDVNHHKGKPVYFDNLKELYAEMDKRYGPEWQTQTIDVDIASNKYSNEHVKQFMADKLQKSSSASERRKIVQRFALDQQDEKIIDHMLTEKIQVDLVAEEMTKRLIDCAHAGNQAQFKFLENKFNEYNEQKAFSNFHQKKFGEALEKASNILAEKSPAVTPKSLSKNSIEQRINTFKQKQGALNNLKKLNKENHSPNVNINQHQQTLSVPMFGHAKAGPGLKDMANKTPKLSASDRKNATTNLSQLVENVQETKQSPKTPQKGQAITNMMQLSSNKEKTQNNIQAPETESKKSQKNRGR